MPGTIYTAEPDTLHDPAGRLADFARFAVGELDELHSTRLERVPQPLRLQRLVRDAQHALVDVAAILEGFTTADGGEDVSA